MTSRRQLRKRQYRSNVRNRNQQYNLFWNIFEFIVLLCAIGIVIYGFINNKSDGSDFL
jgi:hypothetical protein